MFINSTKIVDYLNFELGKREFTIVEIGELGILTVEKIPHFYLK